MITSSIVPVQKVYPLRLLVLRPDGKLADCVFEGDENPDTVHVAVSDAGGQIRAVGSYYEKNHPDIQSKRPIQLRGMASHPDVRGKGFGAEVIRFGVQHYRSEGADVIWCNARDVAVSFYEKYGFKKTGALFEMGKIGLHWVMFRKL